MINDFLFLALITPLAAWLILGIRSALANLITGD